MSDAALDPRVSHLLSLAKTIRHYKEALSQANGERFNLFDILHVGHYEVRTHSPMLAELLNPKGSHGQGAVFLQHFLALLKIQDFDVTSAHVDTEVYIGELGQLDIEIKDGNRRSIFIEPASVLTIYTFSIQTGAGVSPHYLHFFYSNRAA